MKALLEAHPNLQGTVSIPASKSYLHRAILASSLAAGRSVLAHVDLSDDIVATIQAMRHLGATVTGVHDTLMIDGISSFSHYDGKPVDCRSSASTLRFLIPLFSLTNQEVLFTGSQQLLKRPQTVYEDLFKGGLVHTEEGYWVKKPVPTGEVQIPGNISSQFISGLLFALPLCPENSTLSLVGNIESKPYIGLTLDALRRRGVQIQEEGNTFIIPGNQTIHPLQEYVEGDFSQFAFFALLGCIEGPITVTNIPKQTLQGDQAIVEMLQQMGAQIIPVENGYRIERSKLVGTTLDLAHTPDLGPVLMAAGALAQGETVLTHIGRLRIKESDRIQCMLQELKKLGVEGTETPDTVTIQGAQRLEMKEPLNGHEDHRIVMSLAVLGAASTKEIEICGIEAINKSYPRFFTDLKRLGWKILEEEEKE